MDPKGNHPATFLARKPFRLLDSGQDRLIGPNFANTDSAFDWCERHKGAGSYGLRFVLVDVTEGRSIQGLEDIEQSVIVEEV